MRFWRRKSKAYPWKVHTWTPDDLGACQAVTLYLSGDAFCHAPATGVGLCGKPMCDDHKNWPSSAYLIENMPRGLKPV